VTRRYYRKLSHKKSEYVAITNGRFARERKGCTRRGGAGEKRARARGEIARLAVVDNSFEQEG